MGISGGMQQDPSRLGLSGAGGDNRRTKGFGWVSVESAPLADGGEDGGGVGGLGPGGMGAVHRVPIIDDPVVVRNLTSQVWTFCYAVLSVFKVRSISSSADCLFLGNTAHVVEMALLETIQNRCSTSDCCCCDSLGMFAL